MAANRHPLLRFGTTALMLGLLALALRILDVVSQARSNPNANYMLLFLNTGDGVGGTDMGRLVTLLGTLLIPVGLVCIAIYLFKIRSQPKQVGGQVPAQQYPGAQVGQQYQQPQEQQQPQQFQQPQQPQQFQQPQVQPPAEDGTWQGDVQPGQPSQGT